MKKLVFHRPGTFWRTRAYVERWDTSDGTLRIARLPMLSAVYRVWRWLTTPIRYYQFWRYGD